MCYTKNTYVSQPAISQAIRELESEYNVRLFDRNNNQLVITADGKWLYGKAQDLLGRVDEIVSDLRVRSVNKRCVKIGIAPMAGNIYFYPILNKMRQKLVDIIPDVREAGSLEIRRWLDGNNIDIGFGILDCIKSDRIATCKLADAELKFCVHKSHPLANKKSLNFEDLANQSICMLREDSYQNVFIKRKFSEADIPLNIMLYSSQLNSIFTMLSYGNCGAFLFDGIVKDDSFVTISFKDPIVVSLGIGYDSQRQEDLAVTTVRKYLVSSFKSISK